MVIIKTAKVSARLRLAPLLKKILILFMNVLLLSSCFKGGRRMHISIVTTDEERYIFFVIDFTIDTINPNNAGLYTLCVMKEEGWETQFGYWQSKYIAGIYKP